MFGLTCNTFGNFFSWHAHQRTGDLHGLRRLGSDFFCGLHHFRFQRIFGNDLIDDPGFLCGFRGKSMTERQQGKCLLVSHQRWCQQAGSCFRHKAEIDERRAEQGARRCKCQVAMQVDGRADADGKAIDTGNDRLFCAGKSTQKIQNVVAEIAAHRSRHEILHVVAG